MEGLLSGVFKIASRWNAIVLLDEADVFLTQRTVDNTPNNSLVLVFLRQLEYYKGVLFLTTNRVQTFDKAAARGSNTASCISGKFGCRQMDFHLTRQLDR